VLRLLCDLLLRAVVLTCGGWDFWQECTLRGHSDWVSSVAYSPDGKHIVSGSYDNTVKIWDSQSGKEASHRALTFFWLLRTLVLTSGDGVVSRSARCEGTRTGCARWRTRRTASTSSADRMTGLCGSGR